MKPMPQPDPMSAEAFVTEFTRWMPWGKRVLAERIAERDAQRDRAILEAAAERFCAKCGPSSAQANCGYFCNGGDERYACKNRKAILAPLEKEKYV